MTNSSKVIIIMGVSGSGKSTLGKLVADKLDYQFMDADDYHPQENIQKMASGMALNDEDRRGWLVRLNNKIRNTIPEGLVLACSALKESYRSILCKDIDQEFAWIYLDGTFEEILNRLKKRKEHFMPPTLLKSQFDTLEIPEYAISVDIKNSPEKIAEKILHKLKEAP